MEYYNEKVTNAQMFVFHCTATYDHMHDVRWCKQDARCGYFLVQLQKYVRTVCSTATNVSRVLTCVPVGCWCLLCLCSSFFCAQSDSWLYLYRYCIHSLTSLVRKTYTHTGSKSILLYNIMYNIISVLLYNSRDIPLNTTPRHPTHHAHAFLQLFRIFPGEQTQPTQGSHQFCPSTGTFIHTRR